MTERQWFRPCLSGNQLKVIAAITMLIDHMAVVLIQNGVLGGPYDYDFQVIEASAQLSRWWDLNQGMRAIGRAAFPIYVFLLVEGFLHTKDVRKYWLRLLAFCFLSEIPFDLAVFHRVWYPGAQNVFFTLLLGLTALCVVKRLEQDFLVRGQVWNVAERLNWGLKTFAAVGICGGAAWLLKTDYDIIGICLIVMFYMARGNSQMLFVLAAMVYLWEPAAVFAWIPILLYDGTRGSRRWKYWFYAFYPVHLLILWAVGQMIV